MLSKACIVGAYQRKLEEIACFDDVDLTVVVPPKWYEAGHETTLERTFTRGYRLIIEPMAFNGRFHVHFYPGLGRRIHAIRPDILHIDEEPYNLVTLQALWLGRRVGAKTLFFTWQNLYRRYPPPFSWIEAYVLCHADAAIAGNYEASSILRHKGYVGSIDVIPQFGVDPEVYKEHRGGERGERGTFTIGYVGRLVPEKGVELLLEAVAGLEGAWQLRILGAGPLQSSLEQHAAQLGLNSRVRFDAPRPSCQIPAYLNELDVLILPSCTQPNWKEQFGRVLIEAMACGVPVVGSTCGEIPNVIDEAGLIFPEGDVAALRSHLLRLMTDPGHRRRLANAGRQRVLQHFTQAQVAAQTVAVYRRLMDH